MLIDAAGLFGPLYTLYFFLSCRVGVAPYGVSTFAYYALWYESLYLLLLIVLYLMRLRTISADLGCITLTSDVAVVVAAEALYYPIGAVIEFALVYLAFLCYTRVYNSVGRF